MPKTSFLISKKQSNFYVHKRDFDSLRIKIHISKLINLLKVLFNFDAVSKIGVLYRIERLKAIKA